MGEITPAEEGIQAAREDAQRASCRAPSQARRACVARFGEDGSPLADTPARCEGCEHWQTAVQAREAYRCPDCGSTRPFDHSMGCKAPVPDPAEIRRELERPLNRASGPVGKAEGGTRLAAKGSAFALDRAIGHLEGAIVELARAGAAAEAAAGPGGLDAKDEEDAHGHAVELLDNPEDGLIQALTHLRDRRAARAGFSFDEEV